MDTVGPLHHPARPKFDGTEPPYYTLAGLQTQAFSTAEVDEMSPTSSLRSFTLC